MFALGMHCFGLSTSKPLLLKRNSKIFSMRKVTVNNRLTFITILRKNIKNTTRLAQYSTMGSKIQLYQIPCELQTFLSCMAFSVYEVVRVACQSRS